MNVNKNMFMSKIKLFGDTVTSLADIIGISTSRLSAKINSWQNGSLLKLKS
jgi:hypothetical protein